MQAPGCKNRAAPFPGQMPYKATKPGLVLFYILASFNCIVAYYGPFLCIVNFCWYVFCLLVVLVKLSLLAKWLARKTPLRKPNSGESIISIKPRPKRAYDCVGLLYSFVVLLHDICVLRQPYVIHFLLLWHDIAYLCWKCRKTPTNAERQIHCVHCALSSEDDTVFAHCLWLPLQTPGL